MKISLTILFCFISLTYSKAQDTLNNNIIIQLHKAGLSKTTIITKINSSICLFETGTESLIQLKKSGIPDEVIDAMITKSSGPSSFIRQQNDTLQVLPSGIYYCKGAPCKFIELEPSLYSSENTGSGILTSLTYGLAKTKNKAMLNGISANLQISDTLPVFYFFLDRSQSGNLNANPSWFFSATSPNEFILVKFNISSSKKSREVVTGSWNTWEGMTSGIDDSQKVSFKYEKISHGVYKVFFDKGISNGEYCFMYAGGMSNRAGTSLQKVFDFSIATKKGF